jgi:beta-glucanase (GH16 family)
MNSDRRFIALGLLLAVVLVLILASCRESLGYTRLVWADEFDSTSYTMSHWRLGPDPGAAPAPGSLSLTPEGTLTLKIGANTSYKWTNVSTMGPWSTTEPNYPHATTFEEGYFEARLRYSSNEWVWPAFWLFSANTQEAFPGKCDGGSGKLTSEIDILDAGEFSGDPSQPDHYFGGIHENTWAGTVPWCGIADNVQTTDRHLAGKDLTQWHVWSAEWTSEKVDVYVDDELIAT